MESNLMHVSIKTYLYGHNVYTCATKKRRYWVTFC